MTLEATASTAGLRIGERSGRVSAIISPLASSLRALTVDGVDLVEPTNHGDGLVRMAGAVLLPWPNRVEDAVWRERGQEHRLTMTEPELRNANHGLLADRVFHVVEHEDDRITLSTELRQPPGYPFDLRTRVQYRTAPEGLIVSTSVENIGSGVAPVAIGAHPYLRFGEEPTETLGLRIDATHGYRLDDRHIPRGSFALDGSAADLRRVVAVTGAPAHITYVRAGGEHPLRHALTTAEGYGVELWADAAFRWTQLYLSPDFPSIDGPRLAVAVEPMTAPPNALRTGEGLYRLTPGQTWRVSWGLRGVPDH